MLAATTYHFWNLSSWTQHRFISGSWGPVGQDIAGKQKNGGSILAITAFGWQQLPLTHHPPEPVSSYQPWLMAREAEKYECIHGLLLFSPEETCVPALESLSAPHKHICLEYFATSSCLSYYVKYEPCAQSCLILCGPTDYSLLGSSVCGIF